MTDRTASFASAIVISALVSAIVLGGIVGGRAASAEDCLTQPTGKAPDGQHWYYHFDRDSQQRCWYLHDLGDKAARADSAAAVRTEAPLDRSMAQPADTAEQRSVSDAHAELPPRPRETTDADTAAPQAGQSPAVAAVPSAPAPVRASDVIWPDSGASSSAASPSVVPDPPVADDQAVTTLAPAPVTPAAPVEAVAPAGKRHKNIGSLQKLLLVAAGALALAGLIGSAVYRLASFRRHRRSTKERWPKRARRPQRAARRPATVAAAAVQMQEPQFAKASVMEGLSLHDEEAAAEPAESPFAPRRPSQPRHSEAPVERIEEIEEFLARFAKQVQHQ